MIFPSDAPDTMPRGSTTEADVYGAATTIWPDSRLPGCGRVGKRRLS